MLVPVELSSVDYSWLFTLTLRTPRQFRLDDEPELKFLLGSVRSPASCLSYSRGAVFVFVVLIVCGRRCSWLGGVPSSASLQLLVGYAELLSVRVRLSSSDGLDW